ncbi:MAG: hypothetical protein FJ098_10095, partial [Deltaproteobacteria bacterium]|nr:hypothetical protein [Deltaproteobacteria bacterium]
MARGSTARRRRRWRQLAARLLAAVDRRVLAVVVLLWGIGCLRFLVGGGEAVWGGLTLLVLATAGFFGARTWGLPVLGSLLAERTLLTSWREQGIFSFLGELSLQALVAFGAPLLGRLNRRSLARERREEQRLRDEARDSLTDDAPGQGKALDPAAAFERAEASTLAMVQLLKQS